jgi:SNF2 family DNA or RNA helicase
MKKFAEVKRWVDDYNPGHLRWLVVALESISGSDRAYRLAAEFLEDRCGAVIVDESHKIKNYKAIRTKRTIDLGAHAGFKMIMTGTSTAKSIEDLFAQFRFLDPEILGIRDFYSFRNRYCVLGGFGGKEVLGYANTEELMDKIRPYTYQILRSEIRSDLPEKIYTVRKVQLTKPQRELYDQVQFDELPEEDIGRIENVLTKVLRLHQIAGGHRPVADATGKVHMEPVSGTNPKLDELMDVVAQVTGHVVIWATYRAEIELIAQRLRKEGRTVLEYHGGVGKDQLYKNKIAFQAKEAEFLVGNPQTGGVGIDLSVADTMIYYSTNFDYIDRIQSEDRTQHMYRQSGVLYVDIVADNTVDLIVREAHAAKMNLADFVRKSISENRSVI